VALVAQVPPRGSITGVGQARETARLGTVREGTVSVGISANTGYQLIVRGVQGATSRIWVRASTGEFQELKAGGAVTVVKEFRSGGELERSVQYRIEMPDGDNGGESLPVRYEIAINPTI
jgi:hypothetical protein